MDPSALLDMENRLGISNNDVDSFVSKVDAVSKAIEDIKAGTFDPNQCKIPGYKTPEQEAKEAEEKAKLEEERKRKKEEKKRKEKEEERELWWRRAKLRFSIEEDEQDSKQDDKAEQWANRIVASYKSRDANDYSVWDKWTPQDPVTKEEQAQQEALLEKMRNEEFERNNPEFCAQFKDDLEKRAQTQKEQEKKAQNLKNQGNLHYKRKQYEQAIKFYMEAISLTPYNVAILTNIAQSYLREDLLDDCIEFSSRAIYVNPKHIKALSRRAAAYHQQKKLKEAAQDMKKAVEIESQNEDLNEQYSIIVGDYEDFITKSCLEHQMTKQKQNSVSSLKDKPDQIQELHFLVELMNEIDQEDTSSVSSKEISPEIIPQAWLAYELVVPFLMNTSNVRAFFRTSGHFLRLCDRLVQAVDILLAKEEQVKKEEEALTLAGMLQCVTAAMTQDSRNQVVAFRHSSFRTVITQLVTLQAMGTNPKNTQTIDTKFEATFGDLIFVRENALRVLEEAIESKSWKQMVYGSSVLLQTLFHFLTSQQQHQMRLSSSSILFTLSSTENGLKSFSTLLSPSETLQGISMALQQKTSEKQDKTLWTSTQVSTLQNGLGFLTNLSTQQIFRDAMDCHTTNMTTLRQMLVQSLLTFSQMKQYVTIQERSLGILLNLSLPQDGHFRQDLMTLQAVKKMMSILLNLNVKHHDQRKWILIASRTVSLLCRLHPLGFTQNTLHQELTSLELMDTLYSTVWTPLMSFFSSFVDVVNKSSDGTVEDVLQLTGQLCCHFGWCIHLTQIRTFLRQHQLMKQLFQVLIHLNQFTTQHKQSNEKEKVIGNLLKILIGFQADQDKVDDRQVFQQRVHLKSLVDALQNLPDGQARQNVAILLAKLCQQSNDMKENIREMRGIEMMLSISRTMKQQQSSSTISSMNKTLPRPAAY